ncbi:MAG TPA: copper-binding protein [Verrucomicrobiae bacterium]|nr:copper-binding protein [Verrucomicrobiae bacterium]
MKRNSGMFVLIWQASSVIASIVIICLLTGCKKHAAVVAPPSTNSPITAAASDNNAASPYVKSNAIRAFNTRGIIRSIAPDLKTMVVRHEDIPGFMPKMTMEFDVRDTNEVRGFAPGDTISFMVKASEDDSWIEGIKHASSNDVVSAAPLDPSSAALLHVADLKTGDLMPDAELLDEHARNIKLSSFAGKVVAFTFIFTRCPLPEYCPRMNQHFNRTRNLLLQQAGGPTNWQFLSISFDAEFDKPGVLNRYAYSYRGQNPDRWLFAAAPTNVMAAMAQQLDFRFANEGGSFIHNLRTVVLDPQRRIYRQFEGNKWKPEDLARAMSEAASPGKDPRDAAAKTSS